MPESHRQRTRQTALTPAASRFGGRVRFAVGRRASQAATMLSDSGMGAVGSVRNAARDGRHDEVEMNLGTSGFGHLMVTLDASVRVARARGAEVTIGVPEASRRQGRAASRGSYPLMGSRRHHCCRRSCFGGRRRRQSPERGERTRAIARLLERETRDGSRSRRLSSAREIGLAVDD